MRGIGRPAAKGFGIFALALSCLVAATPDLRAQPVQVKLDRGWWIRSSAEVSLKGDSLSRPGVETRGWTPATVPSTVVGALVTAHRLPDPFVGMNLRSLKGATYPIGSVFSTIEMPADSPYRRSWWYRTEIDLPQESRTWWLHFDGINYRANVWVNGVRIAAAADVAGAYRRYVFDVSRVVHAGGRNAIAVEIFPPHPNDLAINWVDWNPTPPDKNMGLWAPVYLTTSGPVALRHAYIVTGLNSPANTEARLTVIVDAVNASDREVDAVLSATIDDIHVSQPVKLAPREQRTIRMTPGEHAELILRSPRLWWPYRMGAPDLYTAHLEISVDGSRLRQPAVDIRRARRDVGADARGTPTVQNQRPSDSDPRRRLESGHAAAADHHRAASRGNALRARHGPQHDSARRQAGDRRVLRPRRSRRHPRDGRLVLLRSVGIVEQVDG